MATISVNWAMYLTLEVQEQSNAPVPDQELVTKVSKSRAIPPLRPWGQTPRDGR